MSDWQRLREIVRILSDWVTLIAERWLCDFRPGIQRATLDFPGGRLPAGKRPDELVPLLLERELGLPATAIVHTRPLNATPWVINSAFSNQGLWGLVAEIDPSHPVPEAHIGQRAPATEAGVRELLEALDCLQCRAVLLEWARAEGCASESFG